MTENNGMATAIASPSNDGAADVLAQAPYHVEVTIEGTSAMLFHRWSDDAVAEKAAAKKGSAAKKSDNVESYVYRDADGNICLPGPYLVASMIDPRNGAAKYRQDPRSPRKSALDLYRAGVVATTELAPVISVTTEMPVQQWDYLDRRRVLVQRAAITRERPAFLAGWRATISLLCLTPEYISPSQLLDTLTMAGRLVGLADFRPTFGRFSIIRYDVGLED